MTRVFIVGVNGSQGDTLRFLQGLGVVHIESSEFENQNDELLEKLKRLKQSIAALSSFKRGKIVPAALNIPDNELLTFVEQRLAALPELAARLNALARLKAELLPWGDFAISSIRVLAAAGICIRRYRMQASQWELLEQPEGLLVEVVSKKRAVLFYTISIGEPASIPHALPLPLPEMGLGEVEHEIGKLQQQKSLITAEIAGVSAKIGIIKKQLKDTSNELAYNRNLAMLHREPHLFGLQGWVPSEREADFWEATKKSELPLKIISREPLANEEPPILLKNNWLVRRIEPLLALYKLPKYHELDPSYFFAPFMILFFGFCMGDVGYGVAFYALSVFIDKKLGDQIDGLPLVMKLCETFSISAIIVGILTGSVFGYNFTNREWIFLDVSPGIGEPMLFFYLALGMGVLHLSTCYLIAIWQSPTWRTKIRQLGLIAVLWGGVALVAKVIWFANPTMPLAQLTRYFGIGSSALGLLLVLFFSSAEQNWGKRIGLGLWNIYGLVGMVADVLSYARLFGLGIATSAIAAVINQLAGMVFFTAGPFLGGILGFLIIIAGHTFNLLLSILSSTVHSARLHFVEAFKIFFEGGGKPYKPFKIEKA